MILEIDAGRQTGSRQKRSLAANGSKFLDWHSP